MVKNQYLRKFNYAELRKIIS